MGKCDKDFSAPEGSLPQDAEDLARVITRDFFQGALDLHHAIQEWQDHLLDGIGPPSVSGALRLPGG